MTWGFIWLMFILKIPIVGLLWLVWWAIHQEVEPAGSEDDGGARRHPHKPPPRSPRPRHRGPHGAPLPPAPARIRTRAVARTPAAPHR
jgi:hypothetical protein